MTSTETPLTSREGLKTALKALLRRAHERGIDVEGGFECRNTDEHPDWDVIVTAVEKKERSE